jgi:hypothetical protein
MPARPKWCVSTPSWMVRLPTRIRDSTLQQEVPGQVVAAAQAARLGQQGIR